MSRRSKTLDEASWTVWIEDCGGQPGQHKWSWLAVSQDMLSLAYAELQSGCKFGSAKAAVISWKNFAHANGIDHYEMRREDG